MKTVAIEVLEEVIEINTQEKEVVVEVDADIFVDEKYVGIDLTSDELTVEDDGEGTVFIS